MDDHFSVEWTLWEIINPQLDWDTLLRVRRQLRQVFAESRYTAREQRMAFYKAARKAGTWQRRIVAKCAEPDPERIVFHWPRTWFAGPGRTRMQSMEVAA